MMHVAPISTRNQFGQMLNEMGLTGEAVEVGTHRGDFAEILLSAWNGDHLHLIDPWVNLPDYENQVKFLWGDGDRAEDKRVCVDRLAQFGNRAVYHVGTSDEIVESFADQSLDFVYIDGNHEPPHPSEDLFDWWPKMKPGGILAMHDFICPGEADGSWGRFIQPAAMEFAVISQMDIHLVVEEQGLPWSIFFRIPT